MNINIEERRNQAIENFKAGYNCSQAVFLAYSDLFELDEKLAKQISAPFGGGMGRLGEVCGALSGAFMAVGLRYPADNPEDKDAKAFNYKMVQRVAAPFKDKFGTIICRDLLDAKRMTFEPNPADPQAGFLAKRPCARFVAEAAEILGNVLMN
jgi:C_GCAxxG_C_C family probable redox protein